VVVLGWIQSLATAAIFLLVGQGVDGLIDSLPLSGARIGLMVGLAVIAGLAAWAIPFLSARDQAEDEHAARRGVIGHVFRLGTAQRTRERTGEIVSIATDGVERAAAYRSTFLGPTIGSMTAPLLVLIAVAVFIDPVAAGILAIALPAIPVALGGFQAAFRGVSKRYRENGRKFAAQFLDSIQGLGTLRLMNADRAQGRRLADAAEDLRRHVMKLLAGNQIMLLVVDSLFSLAFVVGATWLAIWRHGDGAITSGQALALVLTATLLLEPLDRIGQFFYIGMGGIASAKEIKAFQAEQPEVTDAPGVHAPSSIEFDDDAPALAMESVSFAYVPGTEVLHGFDLTVDPGERVALTGPSGAGKTTIAELFQGSIRPGQGRVTIRGIDLAQAPLAWARAQLAVVAQHSYLFTGTLRENLLIADPTADDDRLLAALDAADLSELMDALPDGLDTAVGERGLALSGGQTQRIAIARAFLKDAPIVILDEPTAHVDLASERAILGALERLGRGKTVLTISHRAATIGDADRVIQVDQAGPAPALATTSGEAAL
jgi:ABC-type transport system involved in cytochrome bd biosynthesis fused ATPase/permease subunit